MKLSFLILNVLLGELEQKKLKYLRLFGSQSGWDYARGLLGVQPVGGANV